MYALVLHIKVIEKKLPEDLPISFSDSFGKAIQDCIMQEAAVMYLLHCKSPR